MCGACSLPASVDAGANLNANMDSGESTSVELNMGAEGDASVDDGSMDETADSEGTDGEGAASEGAACLVGTWELDNGSYVDFLNSVALASSSSGEITYEDVYGSARVTFTTDGEVNSELDGFGFNVCTAAGCLDFAVPVSGPTTFTYVESSGMLEFAGGQIVAANFDQFGGSNLEGQPATYTCSGNTLTTSYSGYSTITWTRVPEST